MVINLPCSFENNEKGFFVVPEKPKMRMIKKGLYKTENVYISCQMRDDSKDK